MKTKNFLNLKSWLLMMLMLIGAGGNLWADETVAYTLDGTVTGGTSGYADASNINQNGLSWSVVGNTTQSPWRIGGKSLDKVNRTLQTNAPMGSAISKVDVEIGSASNITVTLFELIVASDADFNNKLDDVTLSFTANHTHEFKPSNGTDWPTDAYYKFIIRVTVSGTSNKFVEFKKATFYKEAAEVKTDPTITFNNESVMVGNTLDLSTLFTSNSEGPVTYSITNGDNYASIDGSTLTGIAAGSVTVKAEQAAYGDFNAGEATATITVNTYAQPTEIIVNMNYVWLGSSNGGNLAASSLPVVKTQDGVTITITDGTSTHPRGDSDYIRIYKGSTMTFEAPTDYNITGIAFTTGGSNTWNAPSVDSGTLSDKTWSGEASSVEFSFSGSCFISTATITLARPSSVATPEFSVVSGTYTEAQNVTITCATNGADIYYTTDGSDPTSDSTPYSGAVTIDHSCTLKAIAVKDGESSAVASASYVILDPNRPGTENNPYTVAQALEADVESGVYVKGIVSAVTEVSTQYHNVTYKISDDGTTSSDQFIVYRGRNVGNSDITSEDDVQVGDVVVVYGNIAEYQGANQLAQGNYLVSLTRPEKPEAGLAYATTEITAERGGVFTAPELTNPNNLNVTYSSSNEAVATVDAETGVVTLLKAGETTITATFDGNSDYKPGSASYSLTVTVPSHTATFFVNGQQTGEGLLVAEDAAITFPATPEAIEGKTFVGWVAEAIDGVVDDAPTFVTSATMGTADVTYYAVFASQEAEASLYEKTDDLTREFTGVEEKASYVEWSGKTATSSAVYAGQSAGDKNSIQLRATNPSGVISTTSGGNVKKVVVTWNSNTASGRTLDIYGKATTYESASELYDTSTQGTKLGSIVQGTSTELSIIGDYQYVGLRSASGAMYLNSIAITWEGGTPATYSGYCTTVIKPVAKIGNKGFATLQEAVDAATDDANIITIVADINQGNTVVNIDKSVTINGEGHSIASTATQAIGISGAGNVTIDNTVITSQNRGINVLNVTSGFTLNVENSTIQTNVEDPTTTYTTGENSRGINIANADGVTVNISNSTIQGYSYNINIPTSGKNLTVNMTGGKTYGRAAVNNWGSNNTITLDGVEVHGLNNQTGPTEAFACVVDNEGAQNNTFVLKDCQFTGTLSEAALTTEGSTASEHLLQLDGMNAIVKVLGSTTYSCNSDDKTRGGIFYTESYLNNNKLYFDDTTKQTFANAFELSVISDEKEAEVDLYPVSFEPEVLYYWAVGDSYQGGYYSFADPFKNGWLDNGEFIALQKDITLTEDITCQLASGTSFNFLLGDFTADKNGHSVALNTGVTVLTDKQTDIFKAAEAGYVIVETETETGYSYTAEKVMLAQPIIFHDGGEYEGELTVAIAGEGVKYTLNGGAEQTYSAPFTISETTKVTAWAEQDGIKSAEVSKTFTIVTKEPSTINLSGYYTIQTSDGKYMNVAGRKTVTLNTETKSAGTVLKVEVENGQVKELRSQAVDLPRYAERAMSYVPDLVKAIIKKLGENGVENNVIGESGADKVVEEFMNKFDYHLYLEQPEGSQGYRIYGKTPSMSLVVDFYAQNKEVIDGRLPYLEDFVKNVFQKVVEVTGHGGSFIDSFKIHDIWTKMITEDPELELTEPVEGDETAISKFYTEVLSSEKNVWNFAHNTAMIYWDRVEEYLNGGDNEFGDLGDYSKYISRIRNIQPNFKYYLVPDASGVDIISQGNEAILTNAASAAWTLTKRSTFEVTLPIERAVTIYPTTSTGETISSTEYYGTLYTDFAYDLPEGVTAYKVEGINTITNMSDVLVKKSELKETTIPAQTAVLLMADKAELTLTLNTNEGTAFESELHGTDWLINEYEINSPTVEGLFTILAKLSESLAEQYEYLKRRNSGTVNNKYLFGIAIDGDFDKAYKAKTGQEMEYCPVKVLSKNVDGKVTFIDTWNPLANNEGFMFSEEYPEILLSMPGDVNRDGTITIGDVTALVNIILGKATYPADKDKYDFEAANVNGDSQITIGDVTALVNIILGK